VICIPYQNVKKSDQIKEDEMHGTCSMHGVKRYIQGFGGGT
jgi:hypothetical protein